MQRHIRARLFFVSIPMAARWSSDGGLIVERSLFIIKEA